MRQLEKYLDFKDEGKFFLKIESTSGNESHVYTWGFFQKAAFCIFKENTYIHYIVVRNNF